MTRNTKTEGGVQFEDAAPEVLAAEQAEEAALAAAMLEPCVPVRRADGAPDCAASNCNFMGGRTACLHPQ